MHVACLLVLHNVIELLTWSNFQEESAKYAGNKETGGETDLTDPILYI